jgi:hypothetical protein
MTSDSNDQGVTGAALRGLAPTRAPAPAARGGRRARGAPEGAGLAVHVTLRLADSRVIAPTGAARRVAARALLDVGDRFGLLAFHVVDTHAHAIVASSRRAAGEFARRAELALGARLRLGCGFEPVRRTPVHDQWHLHRSLKYVMSQEERHGLPVDLSHDGSSLPDVLGWRVTGHGLAMRVRALAPRLVFTSAMTSRDIGSAELRPDLLGDAAAAAFALDHLDGRDRPTALARRAAAAAGIAEGFRSGVVADALGVTRRRLGQLATEAPPPPAWTGAVRIQLRVRALVARVAEARVDWPLDEVTAAGR